MGHHHSLLANLSCLVFTRSLIRFQTANAFLSSRDRRFQMDSDESFLRSEPTSTGNLKRDTPIFSPGNATTGPSLCLPGSGAVQCDSNLASLSSALKNSPSQ